MNDHWIFLDPNEVKSSMSSKNPASIMVLAVISSHGNVMPPNFFEDRKTVTKDIYLEVLRSKVIP